MIKIACAQLNVHFASPEKNVGRVVEVLRSLREQGVDLVVFPEAFLTGYCVETREDALRIAIEADFESETSPLGIIRRECEALNMLAVVGFAERKNEELFNSAALFEPGLTPRIYRKTHLPFLGYDRFVQPGHELPVFGTRLGKVGVCICFDLRIPEAARALALQGAELLVLPTNWPEGAEFAAEKMAPVRAVENGVFLACCNRVGGENGFHFIGKSSIWDPSGEQLATAGEEESILIAEIDPALARQKRRIHVAGKYETELFSSRKPELYRSLSE